MRLILSCVFIFFTSALSAQIIETKHFHEVEAYAAEETLLILDIDDTLLIPVQMLGCDEWFLSRMNYYKNQGLTSKESLEKSLAEWEAVRHLTKMEIVEKGSEKIVESLQNQGYLVMGLTTQGLALATRTHQQLNENGVDLGQGAPSKQDHYFSIDGHGVLYRNGILFTSGTHKGKALFALLDQIGLAPKCIVFLNDKESHLKSVESAAEERGIAFVGLRYGYSDARKAAFKKEIADYQFSHSTFAHLLSDSEALINLEKKPIQP